MKTEELTAIGLTEEQANKVFSMNGKDVEKHKTAAENAKTELCTLKSQLEKANKQIEEFKGMDIDSIKKAADEYRTKYETDTATLKEQLAAKDYTYAVKDAASGLKFTSESAKRAFAADLSEKKLPLQDGKLLGFEDYLKAYKEQDAAAFQSDEKTPHVVSRTPGAGTSTITKESFSKLGYKERLDLKANDPELYKSLKE